MLILDPSDQTTSGTYRPKGPVPIALRSFGRYPNTDQWLPGDVILFSESEPRFVGRMIQTIQRECGFGAEDARWQHAAIYVGQEHICEAVWPRVRFHPIYERVGSQVIRVRRMAGLSDTQRHQIAIGALTMLGGFYGWPELPRILWERGRMWLPNRAIHRRQFSRTCSQLCFDAYASALNIVIATSSGVRRATTPADLSLTSQLDDVPLEWRLIT